MIIKKEVIINSNIEKAWKVLGLEFEDVYKWSSVVKHSEARDSKSINGSSCTERACNIEGMGKIKEKLLTFSHENHELSYQIFEGLPFMMKYAENSWKLTALGANSTKLDMILKAQTKGIIGALMKPIMKMNFSKMGKGLTEDFKYYVENGKPPSKK